MKVRMVRQGDVMLKPVVGIPKDAKRSIDKERGVLARGEVTGHAHRIQNLENVDVMVGSNNHVYVHIKADVDLKHEEHGTIQVIPGKYEVVLQREYSPSAIRNVKD